MPGPLEGVEVLSFAQNLAGPYCILILCDLGAEVIKIKIFKTPCKGDFSWPDLLPEFVYST